MAIRPRRTVETLEPYKGVTDGRQGFVRMDFNENTTGLFQSALSDGFGSSTECFSIYPEYNELVENLSELFDIESNRLLITNGSDEAFAVIASTFVEPGESVALLSRPSFVMISHSLQIAGAKLQEISVLPELEFDLKEIELALARGAHLAIFASPDNPTGALLSVDTVTKWCSRFPDTLFVIDEAYSEYAGVSMLPLLASFDNLLIVKTFSKAWALAGLRLGVILGNAGLISYLKLVRSPYSVNAIAVSAAQRIFSQKALVMKFAKEAMQRKDTLIEGLTERGYKVKRGSANFFLVNVGIQAERFSSYLRELGVLVRNRSEGEIAPNNPLWGKVRVSIGTEEENKRFLEAVSLFNRSHAIAFDLDDTLVDTTDSYDRVVTELVESFSGIPLAPCELANVRIGGGFNDDWDTTVELLKRRGINISREEIEEAGLKIYFAVAPQTETLLCDLDFLKSLSKRHPLFIVTGRSRSEYEAIWGDTFKGICEKVYCQSDVPGLAPKPAPDYLLAVARDFDLSHCIYIGNSVDDMRSATAARMTGIGITSTAPAEVLRNVGAQLVINSLSDLKDIFIL
jgi:histidinol-phosphate aminotransferase